MAAAAADVMGRVRVKIHYQSKSYIFVKSHVIDISIIWLFIV